MINCVLVVNLCDSLWCTGEVKPTVVHRDVNSRNVLVKADLSLCLCDFGFAMKLATPRLTQSNDEHSSLADVRFLLCLIFECLVAVELMQVVSVCNLILVMIVVMVVVVIVVVMVM